jgi:hypothetical protein
MAVRTLRLKVSPVALQAGLPVLYGQVHVFVSLLNAFRGRAEQGAVPGGLFIVMAIRALSLLVTRQTAVTIFPCQAAMRFRHEFLRVIVGDGPLVAGGAITRATTGPGMERLLAPA